MTDNSKFAMLIPAYNAARFLPRLLASAAAQSEPFDEIWVYDDCSTDGTAAVAEALGAKVLRSATNSGCSVGKNALARQVDAPWIHFHDADDELMPNFGMLARRWIADGRFDVVLFPYEERDEATGQHIAFNRFDPDDAMRDARSYAIRRQINPFCGLYRREAFLRAGGYNEDPAVLYNEDVAMHVGLAFAGLKFSAETEVSIINHRRRDSMSSANGLKCAQAQYEVMRKTAARPGAKPYHREIAVRLWQVAGVLAAYLDWRTAGAAAQLASRLGPPDSQGGSRLFTTLASISPATAVRARELMIRRFRPGLRAGYPQVPKLP